jgi:hypothetical protein
MKRLTHNNQASFIVVAEIRTPAIVNVPEYPVIAETTDHEHIDNLNTFPIDLHRPNFRDDGMREFVIVFTVRRAFDNHSSGLPFGASFPSSV